MIEIIKQHKIEIILVSILIAISAIAHGYNMFNYPYYENDEGTYMSQAVSVTEQGRLAPYTYWYDHAPGGWLLIAAWAQFTGGYFTFGESINTGRVLMLVVHVLSALLLYGILRRTSCNTVYSFMGALLFAVSPLAIEVGRRVLLDPMMMMWVLASVFVVLGKRKKLRYFIISAIFFAFAVLTKESAVFFLPALLYVVYTNADLSHRRIVIIQWLAVFSVLLSLYPLFALMKGEFFSYGSALGGSSPHVSLLETLRYQAGRKTEGNFWDSDGGFQFYFRAWTNGNHDLMLFGDPVLMLGGLVATVMIIIFSFWVRSLRVMAMLTLCYWLFLIRGGVIIQFYIFPILPLLAGSIVSVIQQVARLIKGSYVFQAVLIFLLILPISAIYSERIGIYTKNQTVAQTQALGWVRDNIPVDAFILIDNYAYVDITYTYPKAHYYWKAEVDPEIRDGILNGKWYNVDYILSTGQIEQDVARESFRLVGDAMKNSIPVESFEKDGYAVTIRKVIKPLIPETTWSYYTKAFVVDGRVRDPYTKNRTVSEGQSYLLLRAVWNNDRVIFESGWNWTKKNLQKRNNDSLMAWLWGTDVSGVYGIKDSATASDADEDIALALLLANRRWGEPKYLEEAKKIIQDIWKHEVVKVDGKHYLVSSASARREDAYLVNPSYLSPASYKMFAEVDTTHDWPAVADSSYDLLEKLSVGTAGAVRLPTDWVLLDAKSGAISSASKYMTQTADQYGYDAFRVMWRIALDAEWYQEPRANKYLQKYHDFFYSEWKGNRLVSVYTADGMPVNGGRNISTDIGALSVFIVTDKNVAEEFYQDRIVPEYNEEGYWEEKNNYYGQNWAWLGLGLYKGSLNNL